MKVPQPGAIWPNLRSTFTHQGIGTPLILSSVYVKLLLFGDGKEYVMVFCGYLASLAVTARLTAHSDKLNPVCHSKVDGKA